MLRLLQEDRRARGEEERAARWPRRRLQHEQAGRASPFKGRRQAEDNGGVVGILRNFCARSPAMRSDLLAIMELLEMEDATLRVQDYTNQVCTDFKSQLTH